MSRYAINAAVRLPKIAAAPKQNALFDGIIAKLYVPGGTSPLGAMCCFSTVLAPERRFG